MVRALVERAQSGDRDAFGQLVKASTRRLLGLARLILRDPDRAEDAVQDAMLLAWRDLRALITGNQLERLGVGIRLDGATSAPVIEGNRFCGNEQDLVVPGGLRAHARPEQRGL